MLVPKRLPKAKVITLFSILLIAIVMIGYLLYSNFLADRVVSDGGTSRGADILLQAHLPQAPLFDPSFFNSAAVRGLENNGNLPLRVTPDQLGNSQPFGGSSSAAP